MGDLRAAQLLLFWVLPSLFEFVALNREAQGLIKELVQPEVWVDAGGSAQIRYFNGNLIVTAPRSVHEAIGGTWD